MMRYVYVLYYAKNPHIYDNAKTAIEDAIIMGGKRHPNVVPVYNQNQYLIYIDPDLQPGCSPYVCVIQSPLFSDTQQ